MGSKVAVAIATIGAPDGCWALRRTQSKDLRTLLCWVLAGSINSIQADKIILPVQLYVMKVQVIITLLQVMR